jgi:HK97 family phage prohead protease
MSITDVDTGLEPDVNTEGAERPLLHGDIPGLARRSFAADIVSGDGRTVDVRIVPYGERIKHDDGLGGVRRGELYTEEIMPGAFDHQLNAANRVVANYEHGQTMADVIGRGIALRSAPDGFHGTFRILKSPSGDSALELIQEGVLDGVSFEAKFVKSVRSAEGVVQRVKANLFNVAFTRFAAYSGAKVLAVREEAEVIVDEALMPVDMDPALVERCRALGIELPDRYKAHPAETDTPAETGTSEDGTRQSGEPTSLEDNRNADAD